MQDCALQLVKFADPQARNKFDFAPALVKQVDHIYTLVRGDDTRDAADQAPDLDAALIAVADKEGCNEVVCQLLEFSRSIPLVKAATSRHENIKSCLGNAAKLETLMEAVQTKWAALPDEYPCDFSEFEAACKSVDEFLAGIQKDDRASTLAASRRALDRALGMWVWKVYGGPPTVFRTGRWRVGWLWWVSGWVGGWMG